MKRVQILFLILAYLAITGSHSAFADFAAPASTTPLASSRYEVVQSNLAAKWTFLLDRFEGRVYQYVVTQDGGFAWEEMMVFGNVPKHVKPAFQIFTSGLAARHTFLIDSESGDSWNLATQNTKAGEINIWTPFAVSVIQAKKIFQQIKPALIKSILAGMKESESAQTPTDAAQGSLSRLPSSTGKDTPQECAATCEHLANTGQLRSGLTSSDCVRLTCGN